MKFVLVLSALLAFAAETYCSENEGAELKAFLDCFNDKGACDEQAADFKKDLAESVAEACGKCTSAEKQGVKQFLEASKVQYPEEYEIFKQKYDPQQKYIAALEAALANF